MAELPERLVLYDGVCGLCDRTVQWLVRHDDAGRLYFAPLQGPTAKAILARHPQIPDHLDAIVFVESTGAQETVSWRSHAVFRICGHLESRWQWVARLAVIPAFLSDVVYGFVARIRYRIWGKLDQCKVPTDDEKARFLP